jgi:hypothetical protein
MSAASRVRGSSIRRIFSHYETLDVMFSAFHFAFFAEALRPQFA